MRHAILTGAALIREYEHGGSRFKQFDYLLLPTRLAVLRADPAFTNCAAVYAHWSS